jgi:glucuronate isomerase
MVETSLLELSPYRYLSSESTVRQLAFELFRQVEKLPIISPHGHIDPALFSDPKATFGDPVDLFIISDDSVTRMLYSQGFPLESLGISPLEGGEVEKDRRKIWRIFCENFFLFSGTPSGLWITRELVDVFDIHDKISSENADKIYDLLSEKLVSPEYSPRELFKRFNIEALCTTDSAADNLQPHRDLHSSHWGGQILPTFRPDAVINLDNPQWNAQIERLGEASGIEIVDYGSFIRALENRRSYFRSMGAVSADIGTLTPYTHELSTSEAERIFQCALKHQTTGEDAARFSAHMLMEMARMSIDDGLVMQLHAGSLRNYDQQIFNRFGLDRGCDIPTQTEFTRNLRPVLNKFGNEPRLSLIVFTLDETAYSRELAPLAGHYPALKLGSPWWFNDSLNGMTRFLDQVIETAGLYNTAGFNDDTRAFCSIPARHDIWRRASANWAAGLVARHIVNLEDAQFMVNELAVGLARRAYQL